MQTGTNRRPRATRRAGRSMVRAVALLAAALLALTVAGCAGNGGKSGGVASLSGRGAEQPASQDQNSQRKDAQQGALDFARCMREHGVDMPDPKVEGNGLMKMEIGNAGRKPDLKKMQAAEQACRKHLQNGGEGRRQPDPKFLDQALKFARCMRQHGVDMPDPSAEGGLVFQAGKAGGGPDSPRFKQAQRACQSLMPAPGAERKDAGGTP